MPELTKSCSSQPQPAGTSTSTSTSTISSSNNGKRASACGQQTAASRYLPREVPPRFRQQEQKQLLKRGQPLPTGTLTSVSPAQAAGPSGASPPPLPGAGTQLHPSKLQPGKNCEEWVFFSFFFSVRDRQGPVLTWLLHCLPVLRLSFHVPMVSTTQAELS